MKRHIQHDIKNEIGRYEALVQDLQLEVPEPTLNTPDYNQMWSDRMVRNMQLISNVSPSFVNIQNNESIKSQEEKAAICIQKYYRGYLGRRIYLKYLQEQFVKEEEARKLIQIKQVEEAELLIENHQLEVDISDESIALKNRKLRMQYYVTIIQRAWRRYHEAQVSGKQNVQL
ncbi:unnamed protein product [Clavelina lepadiformis]|uniref:Fusion protein IQCJ-SCHIP1 N-terminal domain-containing protein n=1 Tax=Clavelina lepadiformis TaxID=159417 RepID=A0ABP0GI10_CLALP